MSPSVTGTFTLKLSQSEETETIGNLLPIYINDVSAEKLDSLATVGRLPLLSCVYGRHKCLDRDTDR